MSSPFCPNVEEIHLVNNRSCDSTCTELLNLLLSKVNAMQEQLVRLEVKIVNIQGIQGSSLGRIDTERLKKFGLPVKEITQLEKLEQDLMDTSKRNEIVGLRNYFMPLTLFVLNCQIF